MTIRLTRAQCTALAKLIRGELAAYEESEPSHGEASAFERTGDSFNGTDLDTIAPLLAVLEGSTP